MRDQPARWVHVMFAALVFMLVLLMGTLGLALYGTVRNTQITDQALRDRGSACTGILESLNATQRNALSGVRELAPVPNYTDPVLQASALSQRATTQKVNQRLYSTAQRSQRAEDRLRDSDYCSSVSNHDPLIP